VIYYTQYSALKVGFDKQCHSSLYSSHNVRDQVQHPRKIRGKIVDLFVLIFVFLKANLKKIDSAPNDVKHLLIAMCS